MFKIVGKKSLNPTVSQMTVEAPLIARKAEPGQFIIFRAKEDSERICNQNDQKELPYRRDCLYSVQLFTG